MFVGLGLFWGGSFPAIEVGLEAFPPVLYAAARYELGGVLLLAYAVYATDDWRPTTRTDLVGLVGCGTFLIAGNSLLFVGQQFTTGSIASIIYSLIPILTTGFAWLLIAEDRPTLVGFLGVLVGLLGVAAITQPDPSNLLAPDVIGKGFVFLAAISVAFGSVIVRLTDSTLPDSAFMAWSMVVGAILLHVFSFGVGESLSAVTVSAPALLSLVYIAVLSTAVAFVIYLFLIDNYGVLEANLVSYLVPVFATIIGWAYLSEPVTLWTLGGFGLIFVGFVLVKREAIWSELGSITSAGLRG